MQGTTSGCRKRGRPKTTWMDWTAFFSGFDTHWTRYSWTQKTEADGDNSFMVWPSLGARVAEDAMRCDGTEWPILY